MTQLKALCAKIFNKNHTWEDGQPLQDLFAHEFRLLRENIMVQGRFKELYKAKVNDSWTRANPPLGCFPAAWFQRSYRQLSWCMAGGCSAHPPLLFVHAAQRGVSSLHNPTHLIAFE